MKELSIEERAKRYDEAIERARYWEKNPTVWSSDDICQKLFPELKEESGDERIRKELIEYIKDQQSSFISAPDCRDKYEEEENNKYNSWIAWLEKQGEQNPTLPKWKYKNDNTPLLRDSLILNKYGCVAKSPSGAIVSDVWVLDYDELAKLPKEEIEKQGEQKPAYTKEYDFHGMKFIPKFAKGDIIKDKKRGEVSTINDFSYDTGLYTHTYGQFPITIQDNYEIIEQKPVVPKFKVGDVIRNKWSNHTKKIVRIADDNSVYFLDDGMPGDYISAPISDQENWVLVEQKLIDKVEPKFKVGDTVTVKPMSCYGKVLKGKPFKIVDIIENNYVSDDGKTYSISLQDGWELVEHNPANKAEPKFHESDWITNGIDVYKIIGIDLEDENYLFENGRKSDISLVDSNSHLWTIEDAKDGDVLANNGNIILFKEILNSARKDYKYIKSHCFVLIHSFHFHTEGSYNLDDGFHPATKEQRDTLMKAMADAGYTFDFEKKELKKVEQKHSWSEEDEDMIQALNACIDVAIKSGMNYISFDSKNILIGKVKDWLKFLKERYT